MVIVGAVFTMQDMLYYKNNDKDNKHHSPKQ